METRKELTSYFPHDSNARNSDKLIRLRMRHKAAGYGVFFMILERLREEPSYMSVKDYNMIAFDLREDASLIKSVIEDFGLFVFTEDGKYFYSESFKKRMEFKDDKSKKRSEAGKIGLAKRWGKKESEIANATKFIANATDNDSNAIAKDEKNIARKEKESKVKKSKEKESIGKESMRGKRKPFSPPTPSEVESFFTENGYTAEAARRAFDYYTDANWHDAEGKPVLNWKQKMRGVWFKPEHKQTSGMDLKIPL